MRIGRERQKLMQVIRDFTKLRYPTHDFLSYPDGLLLPLVQTGFCRRTRDYREP